MKTSVVITVLDEEGTIGKLLESLLRQTKKPDEVIIVDGGSTDLTVRNIKYQISNIKYFKKNLRLLIKLGNRAVGRNYGISHAKNEIIAVTDAGGYPKKDWLEKITTPFQNPAVQVVSGYYKAQAATIFEKCVTPYFLVMPDKIDPKTEFLPSSRSVAFRKAIWGKVGGYPEQYSYNEDLVFDYKLKDAGVNFYFSQDAIVYWYPPPNLWQVVRKFFLFALGDAQANIPRQKIKLIFLRYGVGLILLLFGFYKFLILLGFFYVFWAISKNIKYAKVAQALFWLPLIQLTADVSVTSGFLVGKLAMK